MVSTYQLKTSFQNLLRPVSFSLLRRGITPNQVTIGTCVLSVLFALVLSANSNSRLVFILVPFVLFVRMALNAIDGLMAKEGNLISPLGLFLNEIGDVISDTALFFAFCSASFIKLELIILFTFFAVISEIAGILGYQVCSARRYDGPMGKSDRAVLLGLMSLMIVFGVNNSIYFSALLIFGILALVITTVNRIKNSINIVK